ncbi:MAG: prepilin-type N-terminal cleavage/methylation domain-containing protein [Campylobacterota bacterium]|nr:prepilin-type N-terminal cleavage/methylation domain-containing protein [Campylobacterota bacterium]
MRKGLTLIEMIFSMVIIAIVFTIVPKIIFASNKSLQLSMKEDALFNAYALMGSITKLAWDENTLVDGKILDTSAHTCNDYREGGFLGSRNCIDSDLAASTIGSDGGDHDDIDDYHGYLETVAVAGLNRYNLSTTVEYDATTPELKKITVRAASHADNNKIKNFQSSFFYHSANLGHIHIKKEQWQ